MTITKKYTKNLEEQIGSQKRDAQQKDIIQCQFLLGKEAFYKNKSVPKPK
jgi:hypothetical protein